jgi:hypothetical protein
MDSSVSPKDEIWFLLVCHHISNAVYYCGCRAVPGLPIRWAIKAAGLLLFYFLTFKCAVEEYETFDDLKNR